MPLPNDADNNACEYLLNTYYVPDIVSAKGFACVNMCNLHSNSTHGETEVGTVKSLA